MIASMTTAQRRLLALTVLVLVIGMVYTLAVKPLMALNNHYLDRIDQLQQRLQILDRKIAAGAELRAQHAQLKRFLSSNRHYLTSETEALAAADLQRIIKRASTANQTEVVSTQTLPTIVEQDFTGVLVKVRMRGKLTNVARLFHSLETSTPYLFIDDVSIRSRVQHSRRLNFNAGNNVRTINMAATLDVEFTVTGYMLDRP